MLFATILLGGAAGLLATLVMDLGNRVVAATGAIGRIDPIMIAQMASGWVRLRFRYASPMELPVVENAPVKGLIAHYIIGAGFGILWALVGGARAPFWATILFGVATSGGALFMLMPWLGMGVLGRRIPQGPRIVKSSLVNHFFYGIGLALGFAILLPIFLPIPPS